MMATDCGMLVIFFMFALSFADEQPECIEVSLFAVETVTRRIKQTLHFAECQEVTMKSDYFFNRPHQFDEKPIDILFLDQESSARLENAQHFEHHLAWLQEMMQCIYDQDTVKGFSGKGQISRVCLKRQQPLLTLGLI